MDRTESSMLIMSTVLAVAGWIATHVTDSITNTPLLEYSFTESNNVTTLELQNVNRTIAYRDLVISATVDDGVQMIATSLTPVEPAEEGDYSPSKTNESANFRIPALMPMSIIRARFKTSGSRPKFRIYSESQPILVILPGIETYISKNETIILVTLLPMILIFGSISSLVIRKYILYKLGSWQKNARR
jgi:hypothetical protein